MSRSNLRKIPTQWLDSNDQKAAENSKLEKQFSASSSNANEWEFIGISSEDRSALSRDQSRIVCGMPSTESRRNPLIANSSKTDSEHSRKECDMTLNLYGGRHSIFDHVGFSDVGAGRLVATPYLFVIRLLLFFVVAMSAGFSYAMREQISLKLVLQELFCWLHLSFFFLMPLLLFSSLLASRAGFLGEEQEPQSQGQGMWLFTQVFYQVAMTLAQVEFIRLFIMHSIPSLRPVAEQEGAELLYSLENTFAAQRYVMVAITAIDATLSSVPMRYENGIFTLFISIPWASISLFSRSTLSPLGWKIGYLFGLSFVILVLTVLQVLLHKVSSSSSQVRNEGDNEEPKESLDIV